MFSRGLGEGRMGVALCLCYTYNTEILMVCNLYFKGVIYKVNISWFRRKVQQMSAGHCVMVADGLVNWLLWNEIVAARLWHVWKGDEVVTA